MADACRGEEAIVGGRLVGDLCLGESRVALRPALAVGRIIVLLGALYGATRESGTQGAQQADTRNGLALEEAPRGVAVAREAGPSGTRCAHRHQRASVHRVSPGNACAHSFFAVARTRTRVTEVPFTRKGAKASYRLPEPQGGMG